MCSTYSYLLLGLPILIVALFFLSRFDGLYGQDPYAYFDYATGPLIASVTALRPPPPFPWPPGYPLLVGLLSTLIGPLPLAGQLVSVVAGALVPVFTALLAREVWTAEGSDQLVPLLAGLLAAFVGQLWQSSVVVMADTTALAMATLGMWALARYGRLSAQSAAGHIRWLALATAAIAYGVLTRWPDAFAAVPAALYALYLFSRQPRAAAIRHGIVCTLIVLLVLSPILGSVLSFLQGSSRDQPGFVVDLAVANWSPLNALRRVFLGADGLLQYRLPNGLYYALAPARRFYFTPFVAVLLLPGVGTAIRRGTVVSNLLLLGWAGAAFVGLAGYPYQNFRFALIYLPPLAVVAAIGGQTVVCSVAARQRRLLGAALVVALGLMAHGGWTLTQRFVNQKNSDLATVHWIEAQVPPAARLLTFGITLTVQHYSPLRTRELYDLDPDEMVAMLEEGGPTYLLIDPTNVELQWQGRPPAENYHWLRDGPGLTELGRHRNFTLWRVE